MLTDTLFYVYYLPRRLAVCAIIGRPLVLFGINLL